MKKNFNRVYQSKITLRDIRPPMILVIIGNIKYNWKRSFLEKKVSIIRMLKRGTSFAAS